MKKISRRSILATAAAAVPAAAVSAIPASANADPLVAMVAEWRRLNAEWDRAAVATEAIELAVLRECGSVIPRARIGTYRDETDCTDASGKSLAGQPIYVYDKGASALASMSERGLARALAEFDQSAAAIEAAKVRHGWQAAEDAKEAIQARADAIEERIVNMDANSVAGLAAKLEVACWNIEIAEGSYGLPDDDEMVTYTVRVLRMIRRDAERLAGKV